MLQGGCVKFSQKPSGEFFFLLDLIWKPGTLAVFGLLRGNGVNLCLFGFGVFLLSLNLDVSVLKTFKI